MNMSVALRLARVNLALMLAVLPSVTTTPPAGAADRAPEATSAPAAVLAPHVPGEVVVRYRPATPGAARAGARAAAGSQAAERLSAKAPDSELLRLAPGHSLEQAMQRLQADPNMLYAEPNYLLTHGAVSDDPRYLDGSLWGMYGDTTTPANEFGSQAGEAWALGHTGSSSVYVAVIDEGMQFTHPELTVNVWTNPFDAADGLDNDGNGLVDDIRGWDFHFNDNTVYDGTADDHGTHVSGTIGAKGGNAAGVAGVNWDVTLIPVKFLGPSGGTTANAVRAVDYVTDLKTRHGLNIVASSNSWGGGGFSQALLDAINRGGDAGILFVAAAGNANANNDLGGHYPSSYQCTTRFDTGAPRGWDCIIAVASITSTGAKSSFSSYGLTSVDLGAPGSAIWSTVPSSSYASYNGTSMATPHVSGAVALCASIGPGLQANQLRNAVTSTTAPTPSLTGITVTGGRLDIGSMINQCGAASGPAVTLSVDKASLNEDGSQNPATVTATLSETSTDTVTVHLTFGGTAAAADYIASGTAIVIAPAATSGAITLATLPDMLDEPAETIFVDISSVGNGYENGFQRATVTITDDDPAPTVTLSTNKTSLAENGSENPATITATLSTASGTAVTVNLARTGTATSGIDFSLSGTAISIPALSLTGSVTLQALQDVAHDPAETVVLDIASVTNGVEDGVQQVTVIITDDDPPPPTVTLSTSKPSLLENGSDGPANVTATLSWVTNGPVTVTLARSGTATVTTDYTLGTVITVLAASLSASIPLTAVQDPAFELTETVVVDIASVTGGTEDGVQQVSVTIVDDDGPPTVTLSSNRTSINENGSLPATITATLSHGTYQTVTVDLGYGGSATGGGVDYAPAATQLSFTPFATTRSLVLTGAQDTTYEGSETIIVDITAVTHASESGVQQVTVSIVDDDPAPVLGGRNTRLMSDALELTWLDGNVEAGYRIYRINGDSGGLDILPAGPPLSPNTALWEDSTALDDVTYCYAVVPVDATGLLLGMSDILCSMRGLETGDLKPREFVIGLNQTDTATLTWLPDDLGADSFTMLVLPLDGSAAILVNLPGTARTYTRPLGGVGHCFLLSTAKAGFAGGNTDPLCAFPGHSTVSGGLGASQTLQALDGLAGTLRAALAE